MAKDVIGSVLVAGGGIAGIQAALDLANSGYYVYMVEKNSSIGGVMAQLDKTFPTNDCSMCIMSPKLVEVGRNKNIDIITMADIQKIDGEQGDFSVQVLKRPRYVDPDKCIACGLCAEKCPKKVDDPYNAGLNKRKAIHVLYPQAVPLKYVIDAENCIKLTKDKCGNCEKVCPKGAINYDDKPETVTLKVGSVIFAPGYDAYDPSNLETYQYKKAPNVVTSVEFERILSASGPTKGHLVRPGDNAEPKRIAWLQCVGSRDVNRCGHAYCSSVCCMYAIKEAIIAKEHSHQPLDCTVFYMDMRTHGKDFEACYNDAKNKHGVNFVRTRVHSLVPQADGGLQLSYVDDAGAVQWENYDLVVLSVGMEINPGLIDLANKNGIELTAGNFARTTSFAPVATSRPGVYVCGAFQGPKDIPQSVIEASSAAMCAGADLVAARGTLLKEDVQVEQDNVQGLRPRVGVFVCSCGSNIGGVVDVNDVRDYAATLPNVEFAMANMYSCSQDTQDILANSIRENKLNRIVVAACSPKTHEPLFQQTMQQTGLNKYLFEFANIRNHVSWVHKDDPAGATQKSKDLIRMAVSKVTCLGPLDEAELEINQSAMVIGGGISGMAAANALSKQGYQVTLVERSDKLGGQANDLFMTWKGEKIQEKLAEMVAQVEADPKINVYTGTELTCVDGFVGSFTSTLTRGEQEAKIEHGVTVIATGAKGYTPTEYLYGQDARVLTHLQLDRKFIDNDPSLDKVGTAVFIQCVGSREPERPYCSRVCCTHSVESAVRFKERNPEMGVYVLYRDIRTYGEREEIYQKARALGVIFIRFSLNNKPVVTATPDSLEITVTDHILNRPLTISADLLTLATAIESYRDEELAQRFKVPINKDGWFLEAHVKLSPNEFATDGVFLCGMAHYPKPIDESVAQAQAAASRAITLLARKRIRISGNIAEVTPMDCSSCGTCIEVCPYNAPSFVVDGPFKGKSKINPMLCKGCGLCVASCRSGAIALKGFDENQIMAQISEAF
jgi:heterodisulfide reductase subunit A